MNDAPKVQSLELSRRSLLRNLVIAAGAAAVIGASTSRNRVAAAETKQTQKAVEYQGTPKGAQQCNNCSHFAPPSSCMVVEGSIAPTGWCTKYAKKSA
jgi:hypothetical protein